MRLCKQANPLGEGHMKSKYLDILPDLVSRNHLLLGQNKVHALSVSIHECLSSEEL